MPKSATRRSQAALLAGLVCAWLLMACAPALAHANLVEASPPPGGEVSKPPERVELHFSEPVDAEFDPVVVRAAGGARVDTHDARVDPEDARVVLADLERVSEGSYTVQWRVTSIDGHVVEGRYDFAVVAAGEDRPPSEDAGDRDTSAEAAGAQSEHHAAHHGEGTGGVASTQRRDSVPERGAGGATSSLAASIEHGLALAASAFLAGLAPFAALVWLPASGQLGVGRDAIRSFGVLSGGLLLTLAAAGVGELSAYAVRASGDSLSTGLFWQTLFDSRVGAVWLVRLGLALLAAVVIAAAASSGRTWAWWAAIGASAMLLMTLSGLSHAAATGRPLPLLADWTHAVAAAVWMGGLLGFAVALCSGAFRGLAPDSRRKLRERSVRRFSAVATCAVVVLACTGLYAALLHVPNPQALLATPYGRALVVKLALLSLLLGVGASNLLLRGRRPFGRLVVIELLLALGLFVVTGFLTSLPPASSA
jgi:copper transport protein